MLTAILKKTTVIFALVALARLLPGVHSGAASPRPAAERDGELGQKIAANWSRRISRVQAIIRLRVIYRAGASDDQIAAAMSVAAGGWHRSRERRLDPPHHHLAAGLRRLPPYQLGNPLLQSR